MGGGESKVTVKREREVALQLEEMHLWRRISVNGE